MAGVNKVILVGNIGQKPELKYTSSGVPFCNFSVATNERWGRDESGQTKEHTEWHRVSAWRKLAEICAQYLDKGKQVYIEGRLRTRSWTTPEGEKRYTTEIQVDEMVMLGGRGGGGEYGDVPDSAYDSDEGFGGGGGSFGGDRGAGAFRRETVGASAFPGNGNGHGSRQAAAGRQPSAPSAPPEVIDLENISDGDFF